MKYIASLVCLTVIAFAIGGCGTAHHFLPPRPLEKGEAMISVAWHFDLGMIHPPDMFPDASVYVGAGNDYNLGVGFRPPFISLNHLTAAKYWPTAGDYWAGYVHINQILGTNNNPYFELGGAYIAWDNSLNQTFSAGLGIGGGLAAPLVDFLGRGEDHKVMRQKLRLMPFAKYAIAGSEFGFSANYYYGISYAALNNLAKTAEHINPPLYSIKGSMIDSVSVPEDTAAYVYKRIDIFLSSGEKVAVQKRFICGTPYAMMLPLLVVAVPVWPWILQSWYFPGFYSKNEGEYFFVDTGASSKDIGVLLDFDELRTKAERREDLVFTRYPLEMADEFQNRRELLQFWRDLSIGLGGIRYEKSDE